MLVSYKWLNEYLDLSAVTPKELADKMSVTGIEVEGIDVPEEGLKKIVVGEVVACEPHPDSDHLSICQVNIGDEVTQIVCGAPNVKSDIKVIVALPGSRITGNVKIKKGKMRGEVSNGMICSLQELGYSDSVIPKEYTEGIYYLPADAKAGEPVFPYLDMDDHLIELSITPNRADALSIRGVAYEVGAIYRQTPDFPVFELKETDTTAASKINVTVTDQSDTPAYQIRIIEDVMIAPSPQWLQNRLMNEGIRPINNVVDVTNYILLLFGQPLHAFDYQKLNSQEILVRRGQESETFVTLDGESRTVTNDDIVITNGEVPVALAGVMGGLDAEITGTTTTVALEAALFDPLAIRLTSKKFNLRSESSARFEKGINQATVTAACDAAAAMIAELAGGQVLKGAVEGSKVSIDPVIVPITLERINRYLGTRIDEVEVEDIFRALGFDMTKTNDIYHVSIPPRRWDIRIEADIIEEVARIYGYDRLPSTLPSGETVAGRLTDQQQKTRSVRTILEGSAVSEAISYALTTEEKAQQFTFTSSQVTRLDWPMTEDRSVLRLNLVAGLLDDLAYNLARKNSNVALYEIGRVFEQTGDSKKELPTEVNHLGIAITGNIHNKDWQSTAQKVDFYQVKGLLENLFTQLGVIERINYIPTDSLKDMHPGRTALVQLDDAVIGFIGQVHPTTAKVYEITDTYVAEVNLDQLLRESTEQTVYQAVSKYPSVNRDIALLLNEEINNQSVIALIQTTAGRFLQSVQLFDVYQGENIDPGKKSLAYSLTFGNPEATLTEEEINQFMAKITKNLEETLQAEVR